MDRRPLSPASLSKCESLLMRLAQFYKYHGINIKTCYADFDKHHIGVVTMGTARREEFHNEQVNFSRFILLTRKAVLHESV